MGPRRPASSDPARDHQYKCKAFSPDPAAMTTKFAAQIASAVSCETSQAQPPVTLATMSDPYCTTSGFSIYSCTVLDMVFATKLANVGFTT
eukprot:4272687-Heterocapsa_arctica.AAC.1